MRRISPPPSLGIIMLELVPCQRYSYSFTREPCLAWAVVGAMTVREDGIRFRLERQGCAIFGPVRVHWRQIFKHRTAGIAGWLSAPHNGKPQCRLLAEASPRSVAGFRRETINWRLCFSLQYGSAPVAPMLNLPCTNRVPYLVVAVQGKERMGKIVWSLPFAIVGYGQDGWAFLEPWRPSGRAPVAVNVMYSPSSFSLAALQLDKRPLRSGSKGPPFPKYR